MIRVSTCSLRLMMLENLEMFFWHKNGDNKKTFYSVHAIFVERRTPSLFSLLRRPLQLWILLSVPNLNHCSPQPITWSLASGSRTPTGTTCSHCEQHRSAIQHLTQKYGPCAFCLIEDFSSQIRLCVCLFTISHIFGETMESVKWLRSSLIQQYKQNNLYFSMQLSVLFYISICFCLD